MRHKELCNDANYPFLLLGNKVDDRENRDVSKQKALDFVSLSQNMTYLETSAKNNTNVTEAFYTAVEKFLQFDNELQRKISSSSHKSVIDMRQHSSSHQHSCNC